MHFITSKLPELHVHVVGQCGVWSHSIMESLCLSLLLSLLPFVPGQTLNPEGLIAPGMHVSYAVTFTPDSLGNYHEEMKVR